MDTILQQAVDLFQSQLDTIEGLGRSSNEMVNQTREKAKESLRAYIRDLQQSECVKELLIQQDDCAPDSRLCFEHEMIERFGLSIMVFKSLGLRYERHEGITIGWRFEDFLLEISVEDPHYKLYQLKEKEKDAI